MYGKRIVSTGLSKRNPLNGRTDLVRYQPYKKSNVAYALHIFNETDARVPRKLLREIYTGILGKKSGLNIIFINDALSKKLNLQYRKKNTPTNVLTFPGSAGSERGAVNRVPAEIYLTTNVIRKEAKHIGVPFSHRAAYLAIHGMLHLLGYHHGEKMEQREDKYATKYIYETKRGKHRGL